tara:strand:- start:364 stop:720 length:357 start_codon:yes stop_codon:yes gene_type:complete
MMQMRDWISGLIGAIVAIIGLSSFWSRVEFIENLLPVPVLRWIVVVAAVYLIWNSIIEITNSNIIGWWSFGIALVALIIGLLPSLPFFSFELFSRTFYNIILIVEGAFLMIATFAMEL